MQSVAAIAAAAAAGDPYRRPSVISSTATGTVSFYDALDQLTQGDGGSSRLSFRTAAETIVPDEDRTGDWGVANDGFDSEVGGTLRPAVAAAAALNGDNEPGDSAKKTARKKKKKNRAAARIRRKQPQPQPQPQPAAVNEDAADDDFGFRYRPAIGPPRPLLLLGSGPPPPPPPVPQAEFQLNTVLPPVGPLAWQPPEPSEPPATPSVVSSVAGDPSVHYYYDSRLLLSGRGFASSSVPRCRPPGDSKDLAGDESDEATFWVDQRSPAGGWDDGGARGRAFDATLSVGATAVPMEPPQPLLTAPPSKAPMTMQSLPLRDATDEAGANGVAPAAAASTVAIPTPAPAVRSAVVPGCWQRLSRGRRLLIAAGVAIGCLVVVAVVTGVVLGLRLRT